MTDRSYDDDEMTHLGVLSETERVRVEAVRQLGDTRANGLLTDLVNTWGPILGPILLKWVLSKVTGSSLTGSATLPVNIDLLRGWVADQIVTHKAELLAFINRELDASFDNLVALVRGTTTTY